MPSGKWPEVRQHLLPDAAIFYGVASLRPPCGIKNENSDPRLGPVPRQRYTTFACTRRAQVGASVLASSCRPRNQSVTSSLSLHGHDPTGGSHGISDSENSLSRLVAAAWPLVARAQQPALSLRDERPR